MSSTYAYLMSADGEESKGSKTHWCTSVGARDDPTEFAAKGSAPSARMTHYSPMSTGMRDC